jgi:hypothetical protein
MVEAATFLVGLDWNKCNAEVDLDGFCIHVGFQLRVASSELVNEF